MFFREDADALWGHGILLGICTCSQSQGYMMAGPMAGWRVAQLVRGVRERASGKRSGEKLERERMQD